MSLYSVWSDHIYDSIDTEVGSLCAFNDWESSLSHEFIIWETMRIIRKVRWLNIWITLTDEQVVYLVLSMIWSSPQYDRDMVLDEEIQLELYSYQKQLQQYIWWESFELAKLTFLVKTVLPVIAHDDMRNAHVFQTHSSELYSLKIGYDRIKKWVNSAKLNRKILFSLIGIECEKLGIKPYMLEGNKEMRDMDISWEFIISKLFDDFSHEIRLEAKNLWYWSVVAWIFAFFYRNTTKELSKAIQARFNSQYFGTNEVWFMLRNYF